MSSAAYRISSWMPPPQEAVPISHPVVISPYQSSPSSSRYTLHQSAFDPTSCSTVLPSSQAPISATYSLSPAFEQQPTSQQPVSLRHPVPVSLPLTVPHVPGFPVYSALFASIVRLNPVLLRPNCDPSITWQTSGSSSVATPSSLCQVEAL